MYFLAAILLVVSTAANASADSAGNRWNLATADTEISISVANNQPVVSRLECPAARHNWAGEGMRVPLLSRVWIDLREIQTAWSFQTGAMDQASGQLALTFTNADPKLVLRSIWRARPVRGPVEHWIEIENGSGRRVTVSHQDSLSLTTLKPGGEATLWWISRGGSDARSTPGIFREPLVAGLNRVVTSNPVEANSPVPWLAVQVGDRRGLYVGWEFSGVGGVRAKTGASAEPIELCVGNLPEFKTDVEPGETFLVPPAFVGCYAGDIDEGSYSLHRFILQRLRPRVPEGCPDPILVFNGYMASGQRAATEASSVSAARWCKMAGFESFTTDAVWFRHYAPGDWRWDPERFPTEGRSIQQYLHGRGVRWGLWCAWNNGGLSPQPGALSVRGPAGHPEWFQADYAETWGPGSFSGAMACLACAEFKDWAVKATQGVVTQNRLDYFKHDGSPIVVQCNKKTHRHHWGVDVSYWSTLGYYEVQQALRKNLPNLVLENCSGGGGIKDFGVIGQSHYTVATDTLLELPNRQSIYDSTFALPPLVLQAYTLDYHPGWAGNYYTGTKGDEPGAFLWRSAMMSAWQCCPANVENWTPEQVQSLQEAVAVYREWIRPILQDVKVHHILPRPDGKHWDGMFHWSPSLSKGTLYIFRTDSAEDTRTIKLKGLSPQGKYWLWCEEGSVSSGVRSGEELVESGLTVTLPAVYTSDLVFLQDASLGPPPHAQAPGQFCLKPPAVKGGPFFGSAVLQWEPSAGARRYRVLVAEQPEFGKLLVERAVVSPSLSLAELPPDCTLYWKVEAISRGGRRFSSDRPGSFTTPKPASLTGVTFASDMNWVKATMGAAPSRPVLRDQNYDKRRITIAGRTCPKGIWTHSFNDDRPADVVLDISGKRFVVFKADAGLDDASGPGSVTFQVLVDGKLKAESPVLRPRALHKFALDVTGAKEVTLRVLNGGDGYACDHAAWGLARFLEAGAVDLPDSDKN